MLKVGKQYKADLSLPVFNSNTSVPPNTELTVIAKDTVIDKSGTTYCLQMLQLNRPEWFMTETGGFNPPPRIIPTLAELVFESVRAYPDLMREELYDRIMECNPRAKRFTIDTMSGMLADDTRVEMFKDGVKVDKIGHNARYCTFRPKGWQP